MEHGHRLGRRRQQRRTGRLELGAVRDDRRLVQPGHEHVDAAPLALGERVLDVRRRGQPLGSGSQVSAAAGTGESGSPWVAWISTARSSGFLRS
ncbi:hypothetical protein GCM10023238_03520 [Streptomyces heliomycini]